MIRIIGFLGIVQLTLFSMFSYADEKSVYEFSWLDKDKEVYVLQNRKYRKVNRLYVGAGGVMSLSGAFIDAYAGRFQLGYFFKEDWGFEIHYAKYTGSENDTAKGVREQRTVPFFRKLDTTTSFLVWWSPFYGKLNTFNSIFYYDWMIGFGLAQATTIDNRNEFISISDRSLTSENVTGATWSTAMRFHVNDHWSVRVDISGLHYNADRKSETESGSAISKSQIYTNLDVGVNLLFAF
jgi:outer membrane beta-barrel protein